MAAARRSRSLSFFSYHLMGLFAINPFVTREEGPEITKSAHDFESM